MREARGVREDADFAKAQESAQQTYIYVLRAGSFCKVGYSRNIALRLAEIRCGCPLEVRLTAQFPVPDKKALAVELAAHKILQDKRIRGEWFKVSKTTARAAVDAAFRTVLPELQMSEVEISRRYAELMAPRRGPYKLTKRKKKTRLKHSGESAQESAQRKMA